MNKTRVKSVRKKGAGTDGFLGHKDIQQGPKAAQWEMIHKTELICVRKLKDRGIVDLGREGRSTGDGCSVRIMYMETSTVNHSNVNHRISINIKLT